MATTLTLDSLYQQIEGELDQVRGRVRQQWTEAFQLVYGAPATSPRLGGKMMRPALCLLSAGACGAKDLEPYIDMAAAMELLHLAALAHDDVVDRAKLRRGESSLNALWDNHAAVLGGDYLVARALMLLTTYDSCGVVTGAIHTIFQMSEGELASFGRRAEEVEEEDCIRLAEKKTASLFAVACSTPTSLTDEAYREPLHAFGMALGTAFQLVDDVLDLGQEETVLGKPSCGDVVEGKTTLPILYMREAMDAADLARFESCVGVKVSAENHAWIAAMLKSTGAQERTESLARKYIDEARAALEAMPQSDSVEAMLGVAEFVLVRDS